MTNPTGPANLAAKSYDSAVIKKLDKSRVEITGSINSETWEKFRKQAVKNMNESVTIDGFRKGMVPENILTAKVGDAAIHEEMAELALSKAYIDILIDNKIDAIGKPQVSIIKLAKGNPLQFKAVTAVVPEVKLPDYKKLAVEEMTKFSPKDLDATDKDVDEAILKLRKSRAPHGDAASAQGSGGPKHDHEKLTPEEHGKAIMDALPEFNDEFVRGLGGEFTDIENFKKKVRVMIGDNKKDEARGKLRIRIADTIATQTEVELPDIMIETELNRTQAQFATDIERMGVKMEDYLKHAKKTLDDIRKEWTPYAEKKAKLQLVLNAIAAVENIKPDQNEIEKEVAHIVEHYKDADKERAAVYAETVLTNEKVFQWLEKSVK